MNGRRDIERTLDHWLADGPSVMPDRLFDAVLDRVERTPQRRPARLHPRSFEMNSHIRLYTLAAGILVAIVGLYLLGPVRPDVNTGGTPSPAATPDPAPTMLPPTLALAALRHTWMSGPRPIPGLDADAGVALSLDAFGTFWMSQSNVDQDRRLASRVDVLAGNAFRLRSVGGDQDCDLGDAGAYPWALSASGRTLEISPGGDGCAARQAAVPGTYWRVDCPTADDNCLGPVDAGTYGSQFIDPFIAPGDSWSPRFGALEYTVPEGWQNIEDWPSFFRLGPENADDGTFIFVATDIVAASETEQCTDGADPQIGTGAEALANWVATSPGLVTTAPVPVTIGGLEGFRVDVGLDPTWTETCPWSEGKPVRALFADRDPGPGFGMAIGGDIRMALHFLDVGANRAILIDIEAPSEAEFDAFIDDASGVVDTFVITR